MFDPAPTISPDGSIRVEWSINTGRMSHEIWSPAVYDAASNELLFDLQDGDIDASFNWLEDGAFNMQLRRYSGGQMQVWVDPRNHLFRIGNSNPEPLNQAQNRIRKEAKWN
jgi:hypothetical protein